MSSELKPESQWYKQSGVIPYRIAKGKIEFLLITSRKKKKWIIPKGIIEPELNAVSSAKKEALEEAGIVGEVNEKSLEKYKYLKWGGTITVHVFSMRVDKIFEEWIESDIRYRKWFNFEDGMKLLKPKKLRILLTKLNDKLKVNDRKA